MSRQSIMRGTLGILFLSLGAPSPLHADARVKPSMGEFMGLNIHVGAVLDTGHINDAPGTFHPAATKLRDYHEVSWNRDASGNPTYPDSRWPAWLNWNEAYGEFTRAGFEINPAIQFNRPALEAWSSDLAGNAYTFGYAFARNLGPTHGSGVVGSAQIGNEIGNDLSLGIGIPDAQFKTVFVNMSAGIRAADPKLPIVTPSVAANGGGTYHKSLDLFADITDSFDVISINTYPQVQGWPTWERTYPESTDSRYRQLDEIRAVIQWRDTHAPDKQIWITEFGYDSSTAPNHTSGTFKHWQGVTDTQQAQWLTRSFLVFASMEVDRAYMYYYNDQNDPSVHASAGLLRNWDPKPSYYAITHLQQTLDNYHFLQAVHEDADALYVHAFENQVNPHELIWAIWSPTGTDRLLEMTLSDLPGVPLLAERMPLGPGAAPTVNFTQPQSDQISLMVGESPIYLHILVPEPGGVLLAAGTPAILLTRRRGRPRPEVQP